MPAASVTANPKRSERTAAARTNALVVVMDFLPNTTLSDRTGSIAAMLSQTHIACNMRHAVDGYTPLLPPPPAYRFKMAPSSMPIAA